MPKYLTNIDLNNNQTIKHRFENYPGNPNGNVSSVEGVSLWDSVGDKLYICTGGTTWIVASGEIVDTNTTYTVSAETATGGANLRLTGSDTSTDDVKIASGTNVTVTRTDANTITISSTDTVYTHPTLTARSIDTSGVEVLDVFTSDTSGHVTAASKRTLPDATTSTPGVMSAADKTKLDGIAAGAEVNVNADWNAVSGDAQILNKPTLGTAAAANTGTSSGNVPVLDGSGKLNASVLPAIAITDTFVVANQAAMLALTAEVGDIAVRTDLNKSFILKTADASILANWQELLTPTDLVSSVNGLTGAVTLTYSNVGAEQAFTKNTAFNKDFGTVAGTVAEGNHNHDSVYTKKYAASFGDGSTLNYVITHNLNTQDAVVTIREVASPYAIVIADVEFTSVNTLTVKCAVAPTSNQYRVIVVG